MKLREVINDGSIENLLLKFYRAQRKNKVDEAQEIQGIISALLMNKGWNVRNMELFIGDMKVLNSEKDIYKLMAKYKMFGEPSELDIN